MKKVSLFLFVLMLGITCSGMAQTAAPTDFFAGKWTIDILETPNGNAQLIANLVRKDGKLTGTLTNPTEPTKEPIPITSIEEGDDKIAFAFAAEGYDLTLNLAKVDNDTLKGTLLNQFEAKATRRKE